MNEQARVQPLTAKIDGIADNSGKLSFALPDGEQVRGEWIAVDGRAGMTEGAATAHGGRGAVFGMDLECDRVTRGIDKATDHCGNTGRVLVREI